MMKIKAKYIYHSINLNGLNSLKSKRFVTDLKNLAL